MWLSRNRPHADDNTLRLDQLELLRSITEEVVILRRLDTSPVSYAADAELKATRDMQYALGQVISRQRATLETSQQIAADLRDVSRDLKTLEAIRSGAMDLWHIGLDATLDELRALHKVADEAAIEEGRFIRSTVEQVALPGWMGTAAAAETVPPHAFIVSRETGPEAFYANKDRHGQRELLQQGYTPGICEVRVDGVFASQRDAELSALNRTMVVRGLPEIAPENVSHEKIAHMMSTTSNGVRMMEDYADDIEGGWECPPSGGPYYRVWKCPIVASSNAKSSIARACTFVNFRQCNNQTLLFFCNFFVFIHPSTIPLP